jgi:hypothetical protein
MDLGEWRTKNQSKYMIPSRMAAQRAIQPVAIEMPASPRTVSLWSPLSAPELNFSRMQAGRGSGDPYVLWATRVQRPRRL